MNLLKRIYFYVMKFLVVRVAKTVGVLHLPYTHKLIHWCDVQIMLTLAKEGDIILSRKKGELTNYLIPGFWKHAMIFDGKFEVIEAVLPKVKRSWIPDVTLTVDHLALLRIPMTVEEIDIFMVYVYSRIDINYDLKLQLTDVKEDFCSEIVFHAGNKAKSKDYFKPRKRLGFDSFTPDDIYKARKKIELIWEKK